MSIGAVAGLAGLKSVELKAMDLNCVEITKKAEAEQKEYETALKKSEESGEVDHKANHTKTVVGEIIALVLTFAISIFLCFCMGKDMKKRNANVIDFNNLTDEQKAVLKERSVVPCPPGMEGQARNEASSYA